MAFEVTCGGLLKWGSKSMLALPSTCCCPTAVTRETLMPLTPDGRESPLLLKNVELVGLRSQ